MKSITGKSLYLIVYNLLSAAGWAVVLAHVFEALYAQRTPAQLWENVGETLTIVQTAAAMEMLHSLLGVTRTPFMSAFLQVMSRLILVHAFTIRSVDCQSHWSLYLMITSWGLVEVPRYLFYVALSCGPLTRSRRRCSGFATACSWSLPIRHHWRNVPNAHRCHSPRRLFRRKVHVQRSPMDGNGRLCRKPDNVPMDFIPLLWILCRAVHDHEYGWHESAPIATVRVPRCQSPVCAGLLRDQAGNALR